MGNTGGSVKTKYWHGSNVTAKAKIPLDSEATLLDNSKPVKRAIERNIKFARVSIKACSSRVANARKLEQGLALHEAGSDRVVADKTHKELPTC